MHYHIYNPSWIWKQYHHCGGLFLRGNRGSNLSSSCFGEHHLFFEGFVNMTFLSVWLNVLITESVWFHNRNISKIFHLSSWGNTSNVATCIFESLKSLVSSFCLLTSRAGIPRISRVASLCEGNALSYLPMRSCTFFMVITIVVWWMRDDKAGSLVQSLFIQRCPGSFSCPSKEHWIQPASI